MLYSRLETNQKQTLQMSSFESRINRKIDSERRKDNGKKVEAFNQLSAKFVPDLRQFRKEGDSEETRAWNAKIDSAVKYTEAAASRFEHTNAEPYAHFVENLVRRKVNNGFWLSNPEDHTYTARAIVPSTYDDYRNRFDMALSVNIKGEASPTKQDEKLFFGFDLTTSTTPDIIRKKILHASNDPEFDAPLGFSQMEFLIEKDSTEPRKVGPIPRYCIGIGHHAINHALDHTVLMPGKISMPDPEYLQQFKILDEMSAQNELYEMELYQKEDDGSITPEESQLLKNISLIDHVFIKERERIAGKLPPYITEGAKKPNGKYDIARITKNIVEKDQDKTYITILETAHKIVDDFDDDPQKILREVEKLKPKHREKTNRDLGHRSLDALTKTA